MNILWKLNFWLSGGIQLLENSSLFVFSMFSLVFFGMLGFNLYFQAFSLLFAKHAPVLVAAENKAAVFKLMISI